MTQLYTPKQARDILGVSPSALRAHSTTYARYLSTEATGNPRNFTVADLRVLAFVVSNTSMGKQHKDILQMLGDNAPEFAAFDWQAPAGEHAGEPMQTALVPLAQLQAAQALMQDAQRREAETREEAERRVMIEREEAQRLQREFQERINALERELGKAEGQLEALRSATAQQSRPFWERWFGRGE